MYQRKSHIRFVVYIPTQYINKICTIPGMSNHDTTNFEALDSLEKKEAQGRKLHKAD